VRALYAIGVTLFLLHWFAQLTGGWQRRGWLIALIAIAIYATLVLAARDALVGGAAGALARTAIVAVVCLLLRFEPLAVPAFVATSAVLEFGRRRAQRATPTRWSIRRSRSPSIAVAWFATRYLRRAQEAAASAEAPGEAATSGDPVRDYVVVRAVHRGYVAARRPRNDLPVQRQVVPPRCARAAPHGFRSGAPARSCRS
jgi:hypothetical protein